MGSGWGVGGTKDKIAWLLLYLITTAAALPIFGWTKTALLIAACTTTSVWAIFTLIIAWRQQSREEKPPEIDWLALGTVKVQVEGTPRCYDATFTGWQPPAVDAMSTEERRIMRALRRLGLPYAVVSRLDDDLPPPEGKYTVVIPSSIA